MGMNEQPTTPAPSAEERLRDFVKWLFNEFEEVSEINVGDIQDEAVKHALLAEVEVTEPCGEFCACAEVGEDFPMPCMRYAGAMLASPRPGEEHGT